MKNKEILVTGGTGSLGKIIIKKLLKLNPKGIRVYSRDEYKQWLMRKEFGTKKISYLIGDVRDEKRMQLAMQGVDIVINTAAMKQVPACEENPIEAIKTNVNGSINIIHAAIENKVKKVMHISTDKAVYPVNLYGMTKGCTEKLFIHGNTYSPHTTTFSCCRYGNVIGSRGSVVPLFRKQKETGILNITDKKMTRFWIKLDDVAEFIIHKIKIMKGQEIFIPEMPSAAITDIAKVIGPSCKIKEIGIRDGEKIHEHLITNEESHFTEKIINGEKSYFKIGVNKINQDAFCYHSGDNVFLNEIQIYKTIKSTEIYDLD